MDEELPLQKIKMLVEIPPSDLEHAVRKARALLDVLPSRKKEYCTHIKKTEVDKHPYILHKDITGGDVKRCIHCDFESSPAQITVIAKEPYLGMLLRDVQSRLRPYSFTQEAAEDL